MPHANEDAAALAALTEICGPQQTLTRWLERVAYASDASVYHLVPLAVVQPATEAELSQLFGWSQCYRIPLTFRAAGTSLSGQAVGAGVLVDLARHWRSMEVLDAGQRVRVQPGVIGAHVNAVLKAYQRKIGPDPASIQACMMGGILANNASGMCCGVAQNAYHTLRSLRFMLPDGQVLDTATADAQQHFESSHPALHQTLLQLRQQILDSPELLAQIRHKYRQKNTTGYGLNALVDYDQSLEMLAHLMIGSEGTLGFIAEATLQTLPVLPHTYTGLLFFASLEAACEAVDSLSASGAAAIEVLDEAALNSIPPAVLQPWIEPLPVGAAALLLEYQDASAQASLARTQHVLALLNTLPLCTPGRMSREASEQQQIWKIRKGLYPSVGAMRQRGTSVIIEDVVFPPAQLAAGARLLQSLFARHGYQEAIIFGHAKDANLHFVLTQGFQGADEVTRYGHFLAELVAEVLKLGGALKAEHGTGRNMAPFVASEWGPEAWQIMQQLKQAIDPSGLLNPDVLINANPKAHLEHLKHLPIIDAEVDACTECGFCEPACPSRRLSLTPRQRIVLRREMARLQAHDPQQQLPQLQADYQYSALETCAADSLCALACPIGLDTGALVKRLRAESLSPSQQTQATWLSQGFGQLETGLRWGLSAAHIGNRLLGEQRLQGLQHQLSHWSGLNLPKWQAALPPTQNQPLPATARAGARYLYLPSCLTRNLGYAERPNLPQTLVDLARRAGVPVWVPPVKGLCCGLPFSSKGFSQAGSATSQRSLRKLWQWSQAGRLPVVMDTSPCSLHLQQVAAAHPDYAGLQILDAVGWLEAEVAPQLKLSQKHRQVVLHPVCSLKKMGLEPALQNLASRCAQEVFTPLSAGCCGFAGDRGLLFPELPAAALGDLQTELAGSQADFYCSSSRSCEMGLSLHLHKPYTSIAYLLAESLKP